MLGSTFYALSAFSLVSAYNPVSTAATYGSYRLVGLESECDCPTDFDFQSVSRPQVQALAHHDIAQTYAEWAQLDSDLLRARASMDAVIVNDHVLSKISETNQTVDSIVRASKSFFPDEQAGDVLDKLISAYCTYSNIINSVFACIAIAALGSGNISALFTQITVVDEDVTESVDHKSKIQPSIVPATGALFESALKSFAAPHKNLTIPPRLHSPAP